MEITYNDKRKRFEAVTSFAERNTANPALKAAGFSFDFDGAKVWHSQAYPNRPARTWEEQVAVAAKLFVYLDSAAKSKIANDNAANLVAIESVAKELHKADSLESSRATDANVELPRPEGLEYLPYQKAGIAYAMKRRDTLIADEMGLGKTIQAIGVSNTDSAARHVLIIAPAKLKLNWAKEFVKWDTKGLTVGVVTKSSKKVKAAIGRWGRGKVSILSKSGPFTTDVVIANYDVLGKCGAALHAEKWDILVADECHKVKNKESQRTQHLLGKYEWDKTNKVWNITADPIAAARRIFLTGTPIVNRPAELWPIVRALDPQGLGKYKSYFERRYCGAVKTRFGYDVSGATNLEELQDKLRATFMVRRLKADVLKELPPKRREVIVLEAPDSLDEILERERAAYAEYEKMGLSYESVPFTGMSAVRKEVAIAKVPFVIEHLDDLLESIDKVVVMCHHDAVLEALVAHFGKACVWGSGTSSDVEVQDAAEAFQTDPNIKVFVGKIIATGVGITLTAASTVVFAELDWVPGNNTQAEDRLHRIGQLDNVLVQHLVLDSSLDCRVVELVIDKQEKIDRALDTKHAPKEMPAVGMVAPAPAPQPKAQGNAPQAPAVPALAPEVVAAIHEGLRYLASVCDGARDIDGCGFNKMDSPFGKSLAGAAQLSQRQALAGQKLIRKYQGQLSPALVESAGIKPKEA